MYASKVSVCVHIHIQVAIMPSFCSALSPVLSLASLHGGLSVLGAREPPLLPHAVSVVRKSVVYSASNPLMGIWVIPNICCYRQCCVNYLVHTLHRNKRNIIRHWSKLRVRRHGLSSQLIEKMQQGLVPRGIPSEAQRPCPWRLRKGSQMCFCHLLDIGPLSGLQCPHL